MLPKYFEIEVKDRKERISSDLFVRWACLIEAIDIINEKRAALGLPDDGSHIKPIAIDKYIKERELSMRYDISKMLL